MILPIQPETGCQRRRQQERSGYNTQQQSRLGKQSMPCPGKQSMLVNVGSVFMHVYVYIRDYTILNTYWNRMCTYTDVMCILSVRIHICQYPKKVDTWECCKIIYPFSRNRSSQNCQYLLANSNPTIP